MNASSGRRHASTPSSSPTIQGELSTGPEFAKPPRTGRRANRIAVDLDVGLRQRGASGISAQIMDLSTVGFRVATHLYLAAGTDVWLRLPGLEPTHARVIWREGHIVGCEFVQPLHEAVFEMIIGRAGTGQDQRR